MADPIAALVARLKLNKGAAAEQAALLQQLVDALNAGEQVLSELFFFILISIFFIFLFVNLFRLFFVPLPHSTAVS